MRLLEVLAITFIRTFGITEPTSAQLRHAAWFIVTLSALVVVGLVTVGLLLAHII